MVLCRISYLKHKYVARKYTMKKIFFKKALKNWIRVFSLQFLYLYQPTQFHYL
jgi:hypothetical protein